MPNIKSAKKRVKVISVKTLQNRMAKTALKTIIKKFNASIGNASKDEILASSKLVFKAIDKSAAKGIIHKNAAARKKSQVAIKLNKLA